MTGVARSSEAAPKGIPDLNRPGYFYAGLHLVSDDRSLKNRVGREDLRTLLQSAIDAGWSLRLDDPEPRKLLVTFDDGRRLDPALVETLDAFDATGLFFVCTGREIRSYPAGNPAYFELGPADRAYLLKRHVVGSHTHAHDNLGPFGARRQRQILADSFARFADAFGAPPRCFSYPWGRYTGATLRALRDLGIRYAFLAGPGPMPAHDLLIPRLFLDHRPPEAFDIETLLRTSARRQSAAKARLRALHARWILGPPRGREERP